MSITKIPEEIRKIKQWSVSYDATSLKRPRHSHYKPNGALSADVADKLAGDLLLRGFYVTKEDPYVLIDVDHIEDPSNPWDELPNNIRSFMLARKTYWESSPSGKGLRGVLKLPLATDKDNLKTSRALLLGQNGDTSDEAEAHFGAPWMTMTGNEMPYSTGDIATVTIEELQDIFNIQYATADIEQAVKDIQSVILPNLIDIQQALAGIPLDQNPRIKRAYEKTFGQEYQHYDFWMKVMMAVNHYAELSGKEVECLDMVNTWSVEDDSYKDYEDVVAHWKSFSNTKDGTVTYKTLFKLRNEATLQWPVPKKQTKEEREAGISLKPNPAVYENFLAVIDYYDMDFYRDELSSSSMFEVFITGDADIMDSEFRAMETSKVYDKYYGPFNRETIVPTFNRLLQKLGFIGLGHVKTREFLTNKLSSSYKSVNFIKKYIETPLHELPDDCTENVDNIATSTLVDLFDCLDIEFITKDEERELNLYRKYYLAWLLGMLRNLYYNSGEPNVNNCVLVLTGREQIRKTSHFKVMFPTFLRKYAAFTTHGFSTADNMRDLAKIARSRLMVVWDEVEQFLDHKTESNFKKVIDNNPQTFIDKYEVHEKTISPIAIYGATSNQREFKLGDQGSRRMFIIPVAWVDTDRMMKICWHGIFNELKQLHDLATNKGTKPWLLTEEELQFQLICHNKFKAKTDFDMVFEEIFNVNHELVYTSKGGIAGITSVQRDTSGQLYTTKEIQELLYRYDDSVTIKRPILTRALERICGKYTRTERKSRRTTRPFAEIDRGQIIQGVHKRWILPPLTAEARAALNVFDNVK